MPARVGTGGASLAIGTRPATSRSRRIAGGTLGVYYAFIQFAGFTMGKAVSQFNAPWVNYPGNNFDGLVGGGGTVTGVNQFTYTAQFGNGVSASIGCRIQTAYYQSPASTSGATVVRTRRSLAAAYGINDFGGTRSPDIVGVLRVDQAWGLFQSSAAAHNNHASYYGATEITGHPDDKWGCAVQAALSIKNIPTGPGDTINLQGVYTDGASRYNFQSLVGQTSPSTAVRACQAPTRALASPPSPDGVYAAGHWHCHGSDLGYARCVEPQLGSVLEHRDLRCIRQLNYGNGGSASRSAPAMQTLVRSARRVSRPATRTTTSLSRRHHPLDPGEEPDVLGRRHLHHLDQKYVGTSSPTAAAQLAAPSRRPYQLKDQDTVSCCVRAQRNF